jgi:hypothetical protein
MYQPLQSGLIKTYSEKTKGDCADEFSDADNGETHVEFEMEFFLHEGVCSWSCTRG